MSPDEILRRQRAARLAADKALLRDLTDEYAKTFQAVRTELARLTKQIAEARARGEVVSPAWLFQSQRLDRFERELGAELTLYLDLAKRKIEAASVRAVMDGREDAHSLLVSTLPQGITPVPAIPLRQLQGMVEGTRPGTALGGLLAGLGEKAALEAREKLIEGVALGLGTREIGRNLRDAFGGNAVRSLLVARTEVIRSYRQAALQTYKQNRGVVAGWVWIASLGPRTCPVCIAKHGSFHPLEEDFASHPACRCSPAPSTKSWADLGVPGVPETKVDSESGEDWFRRQDPITQKAILGPGKYRLYEDGDIQLSDLVAETNSKVWGKGLREKPLRELVGTSRPTPSIDTQTRYLRADGTYTEERQKLHSHIAEQFLSDAKKTDAPRALFLAGGSGAGKSSILKRLEGQLPKHAVKIDPDAIKEMLPEYQELLAAGNRAAARLVHEESSDIAKAILDKANASGFSVIVDGTGNAGPGKFLGKIAKQRSLGYDTEVIVVDIPTETALERAAKRAARTGREIPEDVIRDIHAKVAERFTEWRDSDAVGSWQLWANEGDEPELVAFRRAGSTRILDRARYRQAVQKAYTP